MASTISSSSYNHFRDLHNPEFSIREDKKMFFSFWICHLIKYKHNRNKMKIWYVPPNFEETLGCNGETLKCLKKSKVNKIKGRMKFLIGYYDNHNQWGSRFGKQLHHICPFSIQWNLHDHSIFIVKHIKEFSGTSLNKDCASHFSPNLQSYFSVTFKICLNRNIYNQNV